MVAVREKPRTIGIYYDPETECYARQTQKNARGEDRFVWKKREQLPPRFLPKLNMLDVADFNNVLPGVGRKRTSNHHRKLYAYYLYHETWLKENKNV